MRLFDQFANFEFITATTAIPRPQLYAYYGILLVIYLLFLRGLKPTYLTFTIFLIFNAGFFESLWGNPGTVVLKSMLIVLQAILLIRMRLRWLTKKEKLAFIAFFAFTILFFTNYALNGINLLWGSFQYFKYIFPISLYFIIRGQNLNNSQTEYYANLISKLLAFQVLFSVVKLVILGFRENIVGSLTDTGGSVALVYAIMGIMILWASRNRDINGKDWLGVFALLLLPIASNKRATWFIVPILLLVLLTERISKTFIRNISVLIILLPLIFYFGIRLNPSLNPDKKLWGSFDPQYAYDYVLSYSGVSEEKLEGEAAQGRWGAGMQIFWETIADPFSKESLLGWGRSRSGGTSEEFNPVEFGLMPGTMIAGFGQMIIKNGWPSMLLIIYVFLMLVSTIPNPRAKGALTIYILWDVVFYGGALINTYGRTAMLILSIWIVKHYVLRFATCRETVTDKSHYSKLAVATNMPQLRHQSSKIP